MGDRVAAAVAWLSARHGAAAQTDLWLLVRVGFARVVAMPLLSSPLPPRRAYPAAAPARQPLPAAIPGRVASRQHPRRPLLSLGCCLVALAAAGCGADDEPAGAPLPRAAVAELDKQLRSIENRYAFGDGACADIEQDNRPAVRRALARLPDSVDPDVRRALRQSFARLFELARRQCDSDKPAPAATAPTPPATPAMTAKTTTPPAATATAPVDTAPTDTSDTTSTSKTSPSKTTKRPPTSRQPARRRRDKPNTDSAPQEPSQTDGGSGGTPAPQPRRRRPPQR